MARSHIAWMIQRLLVEGERCSHRFRVELLEQCQRHGALAEGRRAHWIMAHGGALAEGRRAHWIMAHGGALDPVLVNHLIAMYGGCGSISSARQVFEDMEVRNLFSWTAIVAAYAQRGHHGTALQLLRRMLGENVRPDGVIFVVLLGSCGGPEALGTGKIIGECIVREGFLERDVVVGNALLSMYERCGDTGQAVRMFHALPLKNTVSWTSIIRAVAKNDGARALELFHAMLVEGIKVDKVTFTTVLTACSDLGSSRTSWGLKHATWIHGLIVEAGLVMDEIVGATLTNLYGRCGELEVARAIEAFSQRGRNREAAALFWRMQLEGVKCDEISLVAFINACWDLKSLKLAHELLKEAGMEFVNTKSANVLIVLYSRCNCLQEARRIFDSMVIRDIVSWNSIISAYVLRDETKEAVELFRQMDLAPNAVTFSVVLDACGVLGDYKTGREIHEQIINTGVKIQDEPEIGTSLVNFYGQCGELGQATQVFRALSSRREPLLWKTLAGQYAQNGHVDKSLKLFCEMQLEGVRPSKAAVIIAIDSSRSPSQGRKIHVLVAERKLDHYDVGVGNSLINMYAKFGDLDEAALVFRLMEKQDVVSWNSLLGCFAQASGGDSCFALFRLMQLQGQVPNSVTFINVLSSCSHRGLLQQAQALFSSMEQDFGVSPTVQHFGCVVDLLGRKGRLDEAEELASEMPVAPSVVLWTAFLGACTNHEDVKRAERAADKVLTMDDECHSGSALAMLSNVRSRSFNVK
ncbi:pentatricopeptide repeat-containing protein At1g11290, chloroplastic isoform X2 [Selaginella moellendorffii]|uniref:pentatricopeptide repeat-containing protein At1g11290, chloroplastic isoform X2 n=1 Tax=Selaginella moellendorffii TaxID=88036 RepID=UPI000D1CFDD3|nr:pentatricopeptide repeat-containing protein At1g11290, chloroplastic isoform X2 [Selaginella moellendorffii]|eukprot:XP_024528083.1 pentatricopeptide repeat-containing protein At1g11290, chloroplastic isoform X2 [Selaginella moellendorffii]